MARQASCRAGLTAFLTVSALALLCSSHHAVADAARPLADSSTCESCLVAAHVLYDAIGDPFVDTKMAEFLIKGICPNFEDKKSCEENVHNLVEALVEWMRVNLEPDALCSSAGVCSAPPAPPALNTPAALLAPFFGAQTLAKINGPKDITCPLCMFVLTKIKDALSDPITREKVHDSGLEACGALPEGQIRDTCVSFVETNEGEIFDFIDTTEPGQLCEQLAACPAPPPPALVAQLEAMARRALAGGAGAGGVGSGGAAALALVAPSPLASSLATLADGNCDACLAVVKDLHGALASPDLQDQISGAAKEACDALGGADLTARCRAGVDQYAPLVFGMALAYLQPASLCAQMHICPAPPPPSLAGVVGDGGGASTTTMLVADGGRPVAAEVAAAARAVGAALGEALGRAEAAFAEGWAQAPAAEQQEEARVATS